MNTQEQVIDIVSKLLKVEKDKITKDSNFITDLGGDSLDAVEIVLAIEDEFDVIIPDSQSGELSTVGQLVEFINSNKN